MDSAGGGWTLVATINDEDVTKKCTGNDLWFSKDEIIAETPYSKSKVLMILYLPMRLIMKYYANDAEFFLSALQRWNKLITS